MVDFGNISGSLIIRPSAVDGRERPVERLPATLDDYSEEVVSTGFVNGGFPPSFVQKEAPETLGRYPQNYSTLGKASFQIDQNLDRLFQRQDAGESYSFFGIVPFYEFGNPTPQSMGLSIGSWFKWAAFDFDHPSQGSGFLHAYIVNPFREWRRLEVQKAEPIGDLSCGHNAKSSHLRCAINPSGPCKGCVHYIPATPPLSTP